MPAQIAFRVVGSFIAALTVAVMLQGCSAVPQSGADQRPDVVAALSAQADAWDKAIVRKDRRAIEVNMADDFRQIDGNGNVETRQSFVDDLVSPDLEIDTYTVEDFDVRLYGDVALLSGTTRMSGRYQGKPFSSHYRYIDIYVRHAGVWKIVSVQISRMRAASD
jgi:ketosteroid isomerase-like protein